MCRSIRHHFVFVFRFLLVTFYLSFPARAPSPGSRKGCRSEPGQGERRGQIQQKQGDTRRQLLGQEVRLSLHRETQCAHSWHKSGPAARQRLPPNDMPANGALASDTRSIRTPNHVRARQYNERSLFCRKDPHVPFMRPARQQCCVRINQTHIQ